MGIGAAIAGVGLVGGLMSSNAATSAANTQASAANNATAAQQQMFNQTQQNLAPYYQAGTGVMNSLVGNLPSLTAPFNPTMSQLEQTPGYKFQLQQGLEGVQNGFAAKGLGSSGAAMKGAANYVNGLAASDWQNYANNYYTAQNNAYNKLLGITQVGENAAANQGTMGANFANGISNTITGAGNAAASGMVGSANAISNALTGGVNNYLNYTLAKQALGG